MSKEILVMNALYCSYENNPLVIEQIVEDLLKQNYLKFLFSFSQTV